MIRDVLIVLTAYTPIERQRWYRRVADMVRDGVPWARALRIADLATDVDRAEARVIARWWSQAGRVEA